MKKKIFFASIGIAALAAICWVTWLHAKIIVLNKETYLLFTYVNTYNLSGVSSAMAHWDTAIVISNTSADPWGTKQESGACTVYFYGAGGQPVQFITPTIQAGTSYSFDVCDSVLGFDNHTGYAIAACSFPNAHGLATMWDNAGQGDPQVMATVPALVLNYPRPTVHESANESLGQ